MFLHRQLCLLPVLAPCERGIAPVLVALLYVVPGLLVHPVPESFLKVVSGCSLPCGRRPQLQVPGTLPTLNPCGTSEVPSASSPPSREIWDVAVLRGSCWLGILLGPACPGPAEGQFSFCHTNIKTKGFLEPSRAGAFPSVHLVLAASWLPSAAGSREKALQHPAKSGDAAKSGAPWEPQVLLRMAVCC